MAAVLKIAFLFIGFVALVNAEDSNQASQSNLQSITQGFQGLPSFPGVSGTQGIPSFPGMSGTQGIPSFPGVSGNQGIPSVPGMSGTQGVPSFPGLGSFSSSPKVAEDMMNLMTDPCTQKTLQRLAQLSTDMRAAKEKEDKKE